MSRVERLIQRDFLNEILCLLGWLDSNAAYIIPKFRERYQGRHGFKEEDTSDTDIALITELDERIEALNEAVKREVSYENLIEPLAAIVDMCRKDNAESHKKVIDSFSSRLQATRVKNSSQKRPVSPHYSKGHEFDFEIIGGSHIGDKAEQLIMKTPELKEIGFYAPHRTILAEGFFDGFFQRNSLGRNLRDLDQSDDLEAKVRDGSPTQDEFEILQRVIQSYNGLPLAIRSSAQGDARGTGIYRSEFVPNQLKHARKSLQRVLASYFSKDAVLFRQDAGHGSEFAAMIEPIIGQKISYYYIPYLSGFGYTSTSRGEGYISVVPGIGGGVSSNEGLKLTKDDVSKGWNHYFGRHWQSHNGKIESPFWKFRNHIMHDESVPMVFPSGSGDKQELMIAYVFVNNPPMNFVHLDFLELFEMMEKMEESFKKPQYFEWAMTVIDGRPAYWIVQIDDADINKDILDFGNFEKILLEGHTVTGTDIRDCKNIVYCERPENIDALARYNSQNSGYILLYSDECVSVGMLSQVLRRRGGNKSSVLKYSHYNNASVFLEVQRSRGSWGGGHCFDPISHLDGRLKAAKKLLGVLGDEDGDFGEYLKTFYQGSKSVDGLTIYSGNFRVTASERQNRMVVCPID